MASTKTQENRVRRAARRHDLGLQKSRTRDPRAPEFGGYMLFDIYRNAVVYGAHPFAFSASLDEIEDFLKKD